MDFEQILTFIVNNGMSAVIIAYMLWKDYKFNQRITDVLEQINVTLGVLSTWHSAEDKNT